jgi:hypothetical protein
METDGDHSPIHSNLEKQKEQIDPDFLESVHARYAARHKEKERISKKIRH